MAKPSPPTPPRLSGAPEADSKAMEQWYGAFYDNALRGTRLIDPARQFVPDEFDENNLFNPTDSSIANAQLTANNAFAKGAAAIERTVPVGVIVNFPKEPANFSNGGAPGSDTKWLECDGSVYNIADFPDLGAFLGADFGGDGVDTFGVPNYTDNGRFLRSRSSGIAEGGTQDDITSHTHDVGTLAANADGDHSHTESTGAAGSHSHTSSSAGAHSHGGSTGSGGLGNTGTGTSHSHTGSTSAAGSHGHTISISDPTHAHTYFAAAGGTQGATSNNPTNITASASSAIDHTHTVSIGSESSHTHSLPNHTHTIASESEHLHTISTESDHTHSISASGTHTHTISGSTAANSITSETSINTAAVIICIRT